jgi:hypothetical protein
VVCCAIGVVGLALLNSITDSFPISWPSTARATAAAGVLPLDTVTPLPQIATVNAGSIADDILSATAAAVPTETPFGYLPTLPPTMQVVEPIIVPNGNPVITATPYVLPQPPPHQPPPPYPGPHDARPSRTPPPRPLPPALPENPWPLPPMPTDTPAPGATATPAPPVPTPLTSPLVIITSAP